MASKAKSIKKDLQQNNQQRVAGLVLGEMRQAQGNPEIPPVQIASTPADGLFKYSTMSVESFEEEPDEGQEGESKEDGRSSSRQSLAQQRRTESPATDPSASCSNSCTIGKSEAPEEVSALTKQPTRV